MSLRRALRRARKKARRAAKSVARSAAPARLRPSGGAASGFGFAGLPKKVRRGALTGAVRDTRRKPFTIVDSGPIVRPVGP